MITQVLRKYMQNFYYNGFDISLENNKIVLHYSVDDKYEFHPEYDLDLSSLKNTEQIEFEVFQFGMVEIPSFYKTFCTPNIIIKAGYLNEEQILFWENLFTKGLGEFFFRNQIDFRGLIKISVQSDKFKQHESDTQTHPTKVLVPIGGGKDSLVTAEILKSKNIDFTWFMLEELPFIKSLIKQSGNENFIVMTRNIAKNFALVIELTKNGHYNGHVPISSVYAFASALIAKIHGFTHIAISQESSANIGNTEYLGMEINHQYSKSFQAEKNIHDYIHKYISNDIYYFSELRNLSEIQISKAFSKYSQYFSNFISCNKGLKTGSWCGVCDKCIFTWIILSPYIPLETLTSIFGKNLFEDKALLSKFTDLIGKGNMKPFDCVGTFEESMLALYITKENYKNLGIKLPFILENLDVSEGEKNLNLLNTYNSENLIPENFLYQPS